MEKFKIDSLHCMSCYRNIDDALKEFDEKIQTKVDVKEKTVSVESAHPRETIKKIIEEAGFPVSVSY